MDPLDLADAPGAGPPAILESGLAAIGALALAALLGLVASPSARRAVGAGLTSWAGGPAGAESVAVARVVDGDTLDLVDGRTVRLLGVDTPETHNPAMAGPQPLGEAAGARLRELVEGRSVQLEADATDRDHYGRLLRHVWLGRTLVAAALLREGLGRAYIIPPDEHHAAALRDAEAEARAARRGVWGLPRPTSLPIFGTPAR
jgi:micrococcal nuclease